MSELETKSKELDENNALDQEVNRPSSADSNSNAVEILSRSTLIRGLSDIAPTIDRKSFAYTRLDLSGLSLPSLSSPDLPSYTSLRFVSVQNNELISLNPLSSLPSLAHINAKENQISSINDVGEIKSLQVLELDGNRVSQFTAPICNQFTALIALTLGRNKITTITDSNINENESIPTTSPLSPHSSLLLLDLQYNQLTSLTSCFHLFPSLRVLSIRGNRIESLAGIESLSDLERLDAGDNRLNGGLNGLILTLKRVKLLKKLKNLILAGNSGLYEENETIAQTQREQIQNAIDVATSNNNYNNNSSNKQEEDSNNSDSPADANNNNVSHSASSHPNPHSLYSSGIGGNSNPSTSEAFLYEVLQILPTLSLLDGRLISGKERKESCVLKQVRLAEAVAKSLAEEAEKKALADEEAELKRLEAEEAKENESTTDETMSLPDDEKGKRSEEGTEDEADENGDDGGAHDDQPEAEGGSDAGDDENENEDGDESASGSGTEDDQEDESATQ